MEMIWAMKAQHQAETYFKVDGLKNYIYCIKVGNMGRTGVAQHLCYSKILLVVLVFIK